MATDIGSLQAFVTADNTGLELAAKDSMRTLKRLETQLAASTKRISQGFNRIGRTLTVAVTLPILAMGTGVLKTAANFESSMNKVAALSGATGTAFGQLEAQARQLGETTMFSASQSADAMGTLALAGFETNQIMSAVPETLELAAAAAIDLGSAAEVTANIMAGYQLQATELSGANDVLVKTFTSSKVDLLGLGQAFKFVGPTAKAIGLTFGETAAALGQLGQAGFESTLGGTALRGILVRLINPSKEAKRAINDLGVTISDSSGKFLPIVDILKQFEMAEKAAVSETVFAQQIFEIFGQRAGPGMQALLGQGSAALEELTEKVSNAGGITERIAKIQMAGLKGQMIALKSAIEGTAIAIGESGLLSTFTDLATRATNIFREFAKTNPEILKSATMIAFVAAAAGPAALGIGLFFGAISAGIAGLGVLSGLIATIATPLGLIAAAGLAATVVFVKMVGPVDALAVGWEVLEQAWTFWVKQFDAGVNFLTQKATGLKIMATVADIIGKAWVSLRVAFSLTIAAISKALAFSIELIGKGVSLMIGAVGKAWVGLRTGLSLILAGIGTTIKDVTGQVSNFIIGIENLADKFGVGLPVGLLKARLAFEKLSKAGAEFEKTNAEVAAATALSWNETVKSVSDATRSAVETFAQSSADTLNKFAKDNAAAAADTAEEWDNAFSNLKDAGLGFAGVSKTVFSAVKTAGTDILNTLLSESEDKADKIRETIEKLKSSVLNIGVTFQTNQIPFGPENMQFGPENMPGGQQEKARLEASVSAWSEWKTGVSSVWAEWLKDMSFTWENAGKQFGGLAAGMADNFANSMGKIIVEGGTFATAMKSLFSSLFVELIALEIKWAIAAAVNSAKRIATKTAETTAITALNQTQVAGNAAAAAPLPWLIPAFVGAALGFFAGSLSKGSGGGGGEPESIAPASPTAGPSVQPQRSSARGALPGQAQEALQKIEVSLVEARGNEPLMSWIVDQSNNGVGNGFDTLAVDRA